MSDAERPRWWPGCPWLADTFPVGSKPAAMRDGWMKADQAIFERLERELHRAATQPENRKDQSK